jgi:hypothetical protein
MAIIESVEQAQLPPAIQRAASTPDAPNPWIINVSRPTKEKARRDATLATSTQQMSQLLGEYSNSPCKLSPPPERDESDTPQPSPEWPNDLIGKIKKVINTPCATPSPPEFSFDFTEEGKEHNLAILRK